MGSLLKILIICLVALAPLLLSSQDKHFSQFYSSPLQLNPAMSGLLNGSYRINLNYRNQWSGLAEHSFQTIAASGDMKITAPIKSLGRDLLGVGIAFFNDKVGGFDLNTNEVALNAAYHKSLNNASNEFLSLGFKWGIHQRSVNYENLSFEDQYQEGSAYSSVSKEILPENNISLMELALGLHYSVGFNKGGGANIGLSMQHITNPDISFYNLGLETADKISHQLYRLISLHASVAIPSGESNMVYPKLWIISQGPHWQANFGASYSLPLDTYNSKALHAGLMLRVTKNQETLGLESIIPTVALDLGSVTIGFSYDVNTRKIANSYLKQSVFELSLTILGQHDNTSFFCPKF